jgi:hypothetical protein
MFSSNYNCHLKTLRDREKTKNMFEFSVKNTA